VPFIPPGKLRHKIVADCHDSPASGHYGTEKTYRRARKNFYWKGMREEIRLYCIGCSVCSRTKGDLKRRAAMGNTRVPSRPFETISLDIVGPLPTSSNKNKYILVSQCVFSSFIILSPIPDKSAEAVAEAYTRDVFSRFGGSQLVLSDNGGEFKNSFFLGINKLLRQTNVFTLPYRPQANGRNERSHKSLLTSIKSYIIEEKTRCWEKNIYLLELAANSQEKIAHGFSPFFLVHNFDPQLPIESLLLSSSSPKDPQLKSSAVKKWREERVAECRRLRKFIQNITTQEQEKRKAEYAKKTQDSGFIVGDLVWLFHQRIAAEAEKDQESSSRKLQVKWHGPFRVISRRGVSYTLDIVGNPRYKNSRLDCRVHRDRLKAAFSPFDFIDGNDPEQEKINDLFDACFLPESSFVPDEPDEDFEVEGIKEHRIIGPYNFEDEDMNRYEYKIRWKNYDPSFDLWLTKDDLYNCEEILQEYLESGLHQHFQKEIIAHSRMNGSNSPILN